MDTPSRGSVRKRSRLQLTEQDGSPQAARTPLSSVKRRKVSAATSSPSTPKVISALKKSLGGLFGVGNTNDNDQEDVTSTADELGNDIWDVEASESEHESGRAGANGVRKPTLARAMMHKYSNAPSTSDIVPKRGRGTPRKSDILARAKAATRREARDRLAKSEQIEEDGPESLQEDGTMTTGQEEQPANGDQSVRSSGRTKRRARRFSEEIGDSISVVPRGILTPSKGRTKKLNKNVAFQDQLLGIDKIDLGFKDIPSRSRSSLKSSPIKGKKSSQIENTTLNDDAGRVDSEDELSIDQHDNLKQRKSPGKSEKLEESLEADTISLGVEEGANEEDDIACAICSGLDSEEPNEILLCDNCDFAAHQLCCDVPEIPEGDWLCANCRPKTDSLLEPEGQLLLQQSQTAANKVPDIEGFGMHLRRIQRGILDKLTGQVRIKFTGHDEEFQKVHQVVEQTVVAGEGNSMLVIGARGSGKTTLVESVISELSVENRDLFHVVRLNGFLQTDDKLALREIWRQLGREMEVEDEIIKKTNNYADTLASLLALLSHPSEFSETEVGQAAKSVVFILDEFDLFATHPRQTLLYNLFDIAQARKAPIVVLGLTTRIDVMESLEKRVKSRFSHRYVHLSLPRNIPAFWEICKKGLIVDDEELGSWDFSSPGSQEFLSCWNAMIDDLYSKDELFKDHLTSHFYRSKSVPAFLTSCILPVSMLSPTSFPLEGQSFTSLSLSPPDSKLHILPSLSTLDLSLLISAARLDIILDTDTVNFAMAYDEYSTLTSRHKIQSSATGLTALGSSAKVWGREVALDAWERLIDVGLLVPVGYGGSEFGRDGGLGGKMFKVDVGLEEIPGSAELNAVMNKWCREI
ncbi:origin recognition complex subunit 4 C-terminus-domain-containing protein [Xylogone sp. PMI_703]|nr:origin recognition complex subunit 4 C-terminus-domain-containing protein [Xylogone sp. PMI_703]